MIKTIFAALPTPTSIIGQITPPIPGMPTEAKDALIRILNVSLNVFLIIAGLFALLNLVLAGYGYIMASGDPKKVSEANLKITYTVVGLIIIASSLLIAALLGVVIFGRWDAILNPEFKTVNTP